MYDKKEKKKNGKTSSHLLTLLLTNDFALTYNVPNKQPYSGMNPLTLPKWTAVLEEK